MASAVPFSPSRKHPLPADLAKKLPSNIDAEKSILAAILLDNSVLGAATEDLRVDEFFLAQHRHIYSKILALNADGRPVDELLLIEELERGGELEHAGGVAYITQLTVGFPRVSNVKHYAGIVKEKARLREIIHKTHQLQETAFTGYAKADDLLNQFEQFSRDAAATHENPMVVVGCRELLDLEMPEPEFIINPLLTVGGTMMVYSWAGVGKSFITTEIAAHLAAGISKCFVWPVSRAFRVLYLYGEMHGGEIKKRWCEIVRGHGLQNMPADGQFGFVSKEYQRIQRAPRAAHNWRPSIFSPADRHIVEDKLISGKYEVLVLDNISTLWPASQEASSDREATLKNWFIDLNQNGVAVIVLTHAGKGGDFLGDSSQIHILDSVLKLRRPENYEREQQLRAEVKIEKLRHECKEMKLLQEFEVSLETDADTGAIWLTRPLRDVQLRNAFESFAEGMKPAEIYRDLGVSLKTVYRYFKKWKEHSDPEKWTTRGAKD